ncbi:MAG: hypothetical protein EBS68_05205 [Rhodobacteraceae bacterium]|nr:hypothetical protein [Paracoccaceae bacterium]
MFIFAGIFGMLMAGVALVGLQDLLEPEATPEEPEADEILIGSEEDDTFFSGIGDDQIGGYGGDDTADAGSGDDAIDGMDGDDDLSGGSGDDTLMGGAGDDLLTGNADTERDFLNGGSGNDTLFGGASDILSGGDGEDLFAIRPDLSQPVQLMDYSSTEDSLVIVTDNAIDLQTSTSEDGMVILKADGQELARFPAGTDLGKITILSIADATEFFGEQVPLSFSRISE